MPQIELTLPSNEKIWDRLRSVSIEGHFEQTPVDVPGGFPQMFLQNAASTLEHLTLLSIPEEWYNSVPSIPLLLKLKSLRMRGWDYKPTPSFPIYPLSVAFPRLEQLSLASLSNLSLEPVTIWRKEWENIWPHLKVLMFQSSTARVEDPRTYSTLRYLASLNSLQYIHFKFGFRFAQDTEQYPNIFGGNHDPLTDSGIFPQLHLQNLRCLRSERLWISPDRARTLLSNAIKNKRLTSFDIVFPKDINGRVTADDSVRHLKGYDWLRGNPTIHTLGCEDFSFSFDLEGEEGRLLPQFLATFPNLRRLTITSRYYGCTQITQLIIEILKVTHLETIKTEYIGNDDFLRMEEAARSKGTKIYWRSGQDPPIWPIRLE
ncbi:hypothetical protein E4U11_007229 [Claviceps purpurea]|nr:hypothetical protein E4U11_007229 [Claviceps purpurea]